MVVNAEAAAEAEGEGWRISGGAQVIKHPVGLHIMHSAGARMK